MELLGRLFRILAHGEVSKGLDGLESKVGLKGVWRALKVETSSEDLGMAKRGVCSSAETQEWGKRLLRIGRLRGTRSI